MSLKLVMSDGVLLFECPLCGKSLEVGLHVRTVAADPETRKSPVTGTTYGHRVEFIAEAPHLHAKFWGHLVREHQPQPDNHPYLSGGQTPADDDGLSMWEREYDRIQEKNR
jgi:hypothetical protein